MFVELGLTWTWQPVTIENFKEVLGRIAKSETTPLVLNLCDGDEVNGAPGVSVVQELDRLGLTYTGSDEHFYRITTSKIPMKKAFDKFGVSTANWRVITEKRGSLKGLGKRIGLPMIIKPAVSGGSMGVTVKNVVNTEEELIARVEEKIGRAHV